MDTDSLYLALSEEISEHVILPENRAEWDQLRSKDCTDNFDFLLFLPHTQSFYIALSHISIRTRHK